MQLARHRTALAGPICVVVLGRETQTKPDRCPPLPPQTTALIASPCPPRGELEGLDFIRLTFYTDYRCDLAQFAETTGFTSIELSAWQQSLLNADQITDERIEGSAPTSTAATSRSPLGYYLNFFAADKDEVAEYRRYSARSCNSPTALRSSRSAPSRA